LAKLSPYLHDKFIDQINGALIADIIKGRRAEGVTLATIKRDLCALSRSWGSALMRAGWKRTQCCRAWVD
jgi:hypothetical protein